MDKLPAKKIKGRIKVLKTLLYEGAMIYIRSIDKFMFEYLLAYNKEIYSSYIVITPREGKKLLSKREQEQCIALILSGAVATVDTLIGKEATPEQKQTAELLEKAGKNGK